MVRSGQSINQYSFKKVRSGYTSEGKARQDIGLIIMISKKRQDTVN